MIEHCGRPADFTDRTLKNLIRFLEPQDTLYHLGDIIFKWEKDLKFLLMCIPGTKILVRGNHDKKSNGWYRRNGFAFVADAIVLGDVMLSHKPIETLPSGVRLNIHGHWHTIEESKIPEWYNRATHRLLSSEKSNYRPVKLQEFAA